MSPTLRQSLVVGAFATLCAVTATLAIGAVTRTPVLLTRPVSAIGTNTSVTDAGIVTSGDATVSKRPDIAFLTVGVEAQATTASAAQKDLANQAAKLITKAKALGIPDKEINTSGYSIGPIYSTSGGITGYQAGEQLALKWHNVDNVGAALDGLVQQGGATRISVSFGLADPKAAQAEARALAIADARSRASAMAKAAGVQVGSVLRVADYTFGGRTPTMNYPNAAAAADTQVPVGQLDITVTVEMEFAIG